MSLKIREREACASGSRHANMTRTSSPPPGVESQKPAPRARSTEVQTVAAPERLRWLILCVHLTGLTDSSRLQTDAFPAASPRNSGNCARTPNPDPRALRAGPGAPARACTRDRGLRDRKRGTNAADPWFERIAPSGNSYGQADPPTMLFHGACCG